MGVHAKFSPSASSRWKKCPGSIRLSELAKKSKSESVYAAEGTAAHELAEKCLKRGLDTSRSYVGQSICGFVVTDEMSNAVDMYLDVVWSEYASYPDGECQLYIEERLHMSYIHSTDCFGTSDVVLVTETKVTAIDYKHGAGIAVDAEFNDQLTCYGIGAVETFSPFAEEVEMIIVQPRARHDLGPVRRWELSVKELYGRASELKDAAKEADSDEATIAAGDHCRFCPASGFCRELATHRFKEATLEFQEFVEVGEEAIPDLGNLSEEEMRIILDGAKGLRDWLTSLEELVYESIDSGHNFEGYELVPKNAVRKWVNEKKVSMLLSKRIGKDKVFKQVMQTPAQIDKLIAEEDDDFKELIASLAKKVSSGSKLAKVKPQEEGDSPEEDFKDFI